MESMTFNEGFVQQLAEIITLGAKHNTNSVSLEINMIDGLPPVTVDLIFAFKGHEDEVKRFFDKKRQEAKGDY